MRLVSEIRARARYVVGPAIGACAVVYFAYHAVHGDRGLIAWWDLAQEVAAARTFLGELVAERRALDHRVKLLSPASLDPDLLDERVRLMLNYGRPDEIVIFLGPPPGS